MPTPTEIMANHLFVQTNTCPQFAVGTTIDFENLMIESRLTSREKDNNDNSILLYKARLRYTYITPRYKTNKHSRIPQYSPFNLITMMVIVIEYF
jgi:hypothetical protein